MVLRKKAVNKCRKNVVKFSLFHKPDRKYSIPSPPPTLKVSNHHIERASTMKFLHVLLDENLSLEKHIKYLENKMCMTKPFLNKKSLLALYFSISTYI